MPDREKAEEWARDFKAYVDELDIARDDYRGIMEYIDDALALLREQEPVEPKWIDFEDTFTGDKFKVPICGTCESLLGDALYCPRCGEKVKWDE